MKIECHILQNVVPSCLNRDDTNTPKECEFGGVRRARVSSQCWKRAIRLKWSGENTIVVTEKNQHLIGERTKNLKRELLPLLRERIAEAEIADSEKHPDLLPFLLDTFLIAYYSKIDPKKDETKVLLYVSEMEKQKVADIIVKLLQEDKSELRSIAEKRQKAGTKALEDDEEEEETEGEDNETTGKKKKPTIPTLRKVPAYAEEIANVEKSADIALFGRMLAGNEPMGVEAACQVAHALSTHATELEMDFFTAVDDLNPRDDVGAGMLGYVGYSSACLYRYALLDTAQLQKNLGGDAALTKQAVEAFLWAFCDAEPSARQNSMPAHNRPSLALFVAREKGVPTSLANAFCKPVRTRTSEPDLIGKSVESLDKYHARMGEVYEAFEGATQSLFHDLDEDQAKYLNSLKSHNVGSQRKAIAAIVEQLEG